MWQYRALAPSFPNLEPVYCSISGPNCCFLTCIQIFHEAGQVVSYSHLFKNFPQFIVIHTVKDFGIVNIAEVDVSLELSCLHGLLQSIGSQRVCYNWVTEHGCTCTRIHACMCTYTLSCALSYTKTSRVAQMVKRLTTMWETRVQSLGWEDLLEKEMATHSSFLAWKIPWTEEPGRLQSMGSQRDTTEWLHFHFSCTLETNTIL